MAGKKANLGELLRSFFINRITGNQGLLIKKWIVKKKTF
jgi:hypothetical protein